MKTNHWPLADLELHTERLQLCVPNDVQLHEIAQVAADGIHRPGERPFLTPWTEMPAAQRALHVMQQHWARRGSWSAQNWALELGVFHEGQALGMVALKASEFLVRREVKTESWLGLQHQRQGFGTEARRALLELAFNALHAEYALTEVFQDNHASQAVSAKLGYQHDGISRDVLHGKVAVSDRLRLGAADFTAAHPPTTTITSLEACLPFFLGESATPEE